jgi:hypothetical protein
MAAYRTLYSGAQYIVHFRYSSMLNTFYIAMLYGAGMPVLFLLAVFKFFNIYVTERLFLTYFAVQPPSLDDKLTNNAIEWLRISPILMILNGYWMLGNRQIFHNEWSLIKNSAEKMVSGHTLDFGVSTWYTMILLVAIPAFFVGI